MQPVAVTHAAIRNTVHALKVSPFESPIDGFVQLRMSVSHTHTHTLTEPRMSRSLRRQVKERLDTHRESTPTRVEGIARRRRATAAAVAHPR
jgi:hypothetical protein